MSGSRRVYVNVQTFYVAAQSQPEAERYVFAYTITIRNLGNETVRLRERYWLITNGNGHETEVRGEGVVGEQPVILPGGEFQYTSGAVLETPIGTMQGHYIMQDDKGEKFTTPIPVFRLAVTAHLH